MDDLGALIGASPAIEAVRTTVGRLVRSAQGARRPPPVLIQGETGSGKGLLASLLHRTGPRARGPFVDVNCAAIPETLLESELFGFERGAFTDARQAKPGLFQTANRGTMFLDEIALLSSPLQAKLLKVLEEGAVRRLGSTRNESLDVWVISASNVALDTAIREGRFREDLYHRLAVVTVTLPPLRDRGDDVLLLAEHFLARTCAEYGLPRLVLSDDARGRLATYAWPGNVRELANVMERASLLADGMVLTAAMLQLADAPAPRVPRAAVDVPRDVSVKQSVASLEEQMIVETLTETGWNISQTAVKLGISRNTLRARIRKYGLEPGEMAPRPAVTPTIQPVRDVPSPAPAMPATAPLSWEPRRLALLHVRLAMRDPLQSTVETARTLDMFVQKVEAFGGQVVEIATMSLTAAFGFDPVEDAPRRAALAALAMQKAAVRDAPAADEASLMRAALHVMQVPTTRVGAVADIDGDTKRQVWRILEAVIAATAPGTIAVTQAALPLLERRFAVVNGGASDLAAGPIYRLTGYRPTSFDVGGQMGLFVGRAHELGFLKDRFETARLGQGQVVALVGEAGIGKSRLLFEFLQSLAGQPVISLQGHCFSYASSVPYLPILEIVRAIAGVGETDTPEDAGEKIRGFLDGLGMDPSASAPYVLHLLGIKDGADRVAALSPEVIRTRAIETLHAMFIRTSERSPLVLGIEDLHWVDPPSQHYLTSLVERITRARILLAVTYRPGYEAPWERKSIASQVALQPLAPDDSLTIIRSVFGTDEVSGSVTEAILTKGEGNPFFLEELARAVRDHGETSTLEPPDTVQEVLLARINRLPAEERHLLQSAAVIGKDFNFDVLRAIADVREEAVHRALQHLRAAELLDETNLLPPEYTFKHALTHEVAYQSLPLDERRALHVRALESTETIYADRLIEHVERLAYHAFRGDVWTKAVTYLRMAGTKAARRSANREAAACFEQAVAALAHLPATDARATLEIDLRLDLRHALTPLGRVQQTLENLAVAEALASRLDDPARLGRVVSFTTNCLVLQGRYDQALITGARALTIARQLDDPGLQIATQMYMARARLGRGEFEAAIDVFHAIMRSLDEKSLDEILAIRVIPAVFVRTGVACAMAELGRFAEADAHARDAARRAEAAGQPDSAIWGQWGMGVVALARGHADEAVDVFGRLLAFCRAHDLAAYVSRIMAGLGRARARLGLTADGIALLEQAVALDSAAEPRITQTMTLTALGEAYFLAGDLEKSIATATEALRQARTYDERSLGANASWVLAMAQSASGDLTGAERAYLEATAVATDLHLRPLLAHCWLDLGEFYRRQGRSDEGDEQRARGTALMEDLDMRPWIRPPRRV